MTDITPDTATQRLSSSVRRWLTYGHVVMAAAVLVVLVPAIALFPGTGQGSLSAGLRGGFSTGQLIAFLVIGLLAAGVKGLSGFGYALIATPLAAVLIAPSDAVVVLAVPPLMMNLFQVGETGTGLGYLRRNWPLVCAALIGSALGVFMLGRLPKTPLLGVLIAAVLLAYVAWSLLRHSRPATRTAHPAGLGAVGVVEGFLLGSVNMGPLLPAYLHSFERNARRYIGGMSLVFTLVFAERIGQMLGDGLMTPYRLWLGSVIGLVTLVGLVLGTALRRWGRVDTRVFNGIVLALLSATGLTILVRALPHLL